MPMIGARFYTQLDALQLRTDLMENEISKEMENGRLFRLLVKLGTINERPEYDRYFFFTKMKIFLIVHYTLITIIILIFNFHIDCVLKKLLQFLERIENINDDVLHNIYCIIKN